MRALLLLVPIAATAAFAKKAEPLKNSPVTYFKAHCARCHGTDGGMYDDGFDKKISDKDLRDVIDRMATGPGQAPIDGIDLDAQVAYHRAIGSHLPFLAWTAQKGQTLSGDFTLSGEKLTAKLGKKKLPIQEKDRIWTLILPKGAKVEDLILSVDKTTFKPATKPFTQKK